jgi:hypothetical protein
MTPRQLNSILHTPNGNGILLLPDSINNWNPQVPNAIAILPENCSFLSSLMNEKLTKNLLKNMPSSKKIVQLKKVFSEKTCFLKDFRWKVLF